MFRLPNSPFKIFNANVRYDENSEEIVSKYKYSTTVIRNNFDICPREDHLLIKTSTAVPKLGVLLVGWGGNNGSTITAGVLANKLGLSWETKDGFVNANYYGSITQSSTLCLGLDEQGKQIYLPLNQLLPMVNPNDLIIHGWDISSVNLAEAMKRAKVLDIDLQKQLYCHMETMQPMPGIYCENFIASNQSSRVDNIISGTKSVQISKLRDQIRQFKSTNSLDKVIVLWTANTERFCDVKQGLNDTGDNLLNSIERNEDEISPSTLYAVASILEGCHYINGSPQNTFVPGVIDLAEKHHVFIAGDDFKSGQTKMKSVLVDYLVSAGIKPMSIVSYNHLGNNDGMNLSAPEQFKSKEISKSNVIDDIVASNQILYKSQDESPDHCVVIKYVPYVGDSKRAMDEYTSEIFLGGKNTIVMHNTCEDSLLASPIILDLIILCEMCDRIQIKRDGDDHQYEKPYSVLSILSYLMKAPLVPANTPVVNALYPQRQCIMNLFRACVGLPPENYMMLEHKVPCLMKSTSSSQHSQTSEFSESCSSNQSTPVTVTALDLDKILKKQKNCVENDS